MKKILRRNAVLRAERILLLILILCSALPVRGDVIITAPSLTITACGTFPSSSYVLGNIIIAESATGDISTFGTVILRAPANFEFMSAGTASFSGVNGSNIFSVLTTLNNPTQITLTITGNGIHKKDFIFIKGIRIRATNAAAGPANVIRNGGTAVIAGDISGSVHAILTSVQGFALSAPSTSGASRCDAGPLSLSASGGSTGSYLWYTAATGGNIVAWTPDYETPYLMSSTNYYISSVNFENENMLSGTLNSSGHTAAYIAIGFDVTNHHYAPLRVNRISERFGQLGAGGQAHVFYRMGSYAGHMESSWGWTDAGLSPITAITQNTAPTVFDIPDVVIPAGATYGFYIFFSVSAGSYSSSAVSTSDYYASLQQGSILADPADAFVGGVLQASASFTGSIYYQLVRCESERTSCTAMISGYDAPEVNIASQQGNILCSGNGATFIATTAWGGSTPVYQWLRNGVIIPGATASVYTAGSLSAGDVLSCVMTSSYACAWPGTDTSNRITIENSSPTIITAQPAAVTLCQQGNALFNCTANPAGPYQWQVSSDNGNSWWNITEAGSSPVYSGFNSASLSVNAVDDAHNGLLFRCMAGCTPSHQALLTAHPLVDPVTTGSGSCTAPASLVLSAAGAVAGEIYRWYDAPLGGNLLKSGSNNTDNTYTATNISATTPYYVTIRSADGCESAPRTAVMAEIYSAPVVTTPPSNSTVPEGGHTSFNVNVAGSLLQYQWQVNDGSGFHNITQAGLNPIYSGWNTQTLLLEGVILSNHGFEYRCLVSGACAPPVISGTGSLNIGNEEPGGPYFHPTMGLLYTNLGICLVSTHSGNYYDNGGSGNGYANNISDIYRTFCPDADHQALTADVLQLQVEYLGGDCSDFLIIQNGPNPEADILWSGCGNSSINNILTDDGTYNEGHFISTHPSGCLTFRFQSDAANNGNWDGWDILLGSVYFEGGPTGTTNNDCVNSTPICSSITTSSFTYGPGLTSDACTGCVRSESFVEWYQLRMSSGGLIEVEITPLGVADFDFAIYTGRACNALGDPIRCSYAARGNSNGKTGLRVGAGDLSEGIYGDQWVQPITAVAGETYYLLINEKNKPNPNQYTIDWFLSNGASFDCGILLPVEMASFGGACNDGHILLEWSTWSESNNDYFVIERAGETGTFIPIGYTDGAGNSNEERQYRFRDPEPSAGPAYYRIQQIDFDGASAYSEVIHSACAIETDEGIVLLDQQDQGFLGLQFAALTGASYTVQLIDLNGKIAQSVAYTARGTSGRVQLSTRSLAAGIYQLRLNSPGVGPRETRVMIR